MPKDWGLEWRLVPAKGRESCRWQSVDAAWVSVTLGHQRDITKVVVAASDGRSEVVDGYEEGLNLARRWRTAWVSRRSTPAGSETSAPEWATARLTDPGPPTQPIARSVGSAGRFAGPEAPTQPGGRSPSPAATTQPTGRSAPPTTTTQPPRPAPAATTQPASRSAPAPEPTAPAQPGRSPTTWPRGSATPPRRTEPPARPTPHAMPQIFVGPDGIPRTARSPAGDPTLRTSPWPPPGLAQRTTDKLAAISPEAPPTSERSLLELPPLVPERPTTGPLTVLRTDDDDASPALDEDRLAARRRHSRPPLLPRK